MILIDKSKSTKTINLFFEIIFLLFLLYVQSGVLLLRARSSIFDLDRINNNKQQKENVNRFLKNNRPKMQLC